MEGQAEGLAYADPVARTPIGVSGNFVVFLQFPWVYNKNSLHFPKDQFHAYNENNVNLIPSVHIDWGYSQFCMWLIILQCFLNHVKKMPQLRTY